MKVGIVVPYSWSFWGGVVEHAEYQARALQALGVETRTLIGHDPPGAFSRVLHPRSGRHERPPPDVIPLGRSVIVAANGSLANIVIGPSAILRLRRALRREVSRLQDPRRVAAVFLLSLTFALILSGLIARGEAGGADARAYWAGVRIWLNGGDPYHPVGPFLPYVYAPWMLPMFAPWALLPWDVAWFIWRVGTILLLLWTIHWAYRRRPLTTAVVVAVLAFPFGANLDTGNINLQLTLMLWAAQFTGPRLGGLLWALATWMKWLPVVRSSVQPARCRIFPSSLPVRRGNRSLTRG